MLNLSSLEQKLKDLKPMFQDAYRESFKQMFNSKSDEIDEKADLFADNMTMNHDTISETLAGIIDYYVNSIGLSGTIITTGGPSTQMAQITFMPMNQLNGKVPNTIGIN